MLRLDSSGAKTILCLGAHSDDIEIGCGGTLLQLLAARSDLEVHWVVFSAAGPRAVEAKASAEGAFLRRLHKGACGIFSTVLGPEANEAHRDHFHLDLAARRRGSFCE